MEVIREKLKEYNPIYRYKLKKKRKTITNRDFTLLTSNCIGGIIYHELGVRFNSPTINTRMDSPDFIRFVVDIRDYLEADLKFVETQETFPVAMLKDIRINFVHYKTKEEAETKWKERIKRINWDNVWIITSDADGVTRADLDKLKEITYAKGIVVFSVKDYENYDFIHKIPANSKRQMINYLQMNKFIGVRKFERYFDYVSWLNGKKEREICQK